MRETRICCSPQIESLGTFHQHHNARGLVDTSNMILVMSVMDVMQCHDKEDLEHEIFLRTL